LFILESIVNWKDKNNKLNNEIKKIKMGDNLARNKLISTYKPFIAKVVSKTTNKFIDMNNSDEFCVGLFAFNRAIDSYNIDKGSFINYAEILIRSRVIDYLRKKKKEEIPFTDLEGSCEMDFISSRKDVKAGIGFEDFESADEIEFFKKELAKFEISFKDLVSVTPKHKDSVKNCIGISMIIFENHDLYNYFITKKVLPIKKIMKYTHLHRKTIERNRKFIIALVLLLKSDLNIIKSYLYYTERAGEKNI
jgi:RNA polymerase sigma factor